MPFDIAPLLNADPAAAGELFSRHVNPAMAKVLKIIGFDVPFVRGQGPYLYDKAGTRYLDCLAGYGTFACGRNHPVIRRTLQQVMDTDTSNLVKMGLPRLSGELARQLCELAPGDMDRVFFTNSGAEGVETAMKFARIATGRSRIVHAAKAFHGLSYGALSVNGNDEFREGFGPLLPGCTPVAFNDLEALAAQLTGGDVAGFIVEPIQGKGVNMPTNDYLPRAAELCRRHGTLLIVDEVQTGLGRTGKMFACDHWAIEPDILIIAKALSGGYVPCGAVLSRSWIHDKVYSSLDRCMVHSTTFGQNDLAMAAGLATLAVLQEERIVENAHAMGNRLVEGLRALMPKYEMLHDVRGKGLMVAVEFGPPSSTTLRMGWKALHAVDNGLFPQAIVVPLMTDHHILSQVAGHHLDVIKLIPPLVVNETDIDHLIDAFDQTIAVCHRFPGPMWQIATRLGKHALRHTPKTAAE